jgi:hypothetical protein
MSTLNNEEVKKEILNFIQEDGLKMMIGWYKDKKRVFPMLIEDGVPISTNLFYGMAIRNHIQKKFNVVPDKINNWGTYEDYIYNMLENILKEKIKEGY